ncbi:hypothetical protein V7148_19650 [Gottfriedia acidiceleris]|uniref:hypothetical protein n=1 Tax=Bacillaceae TaxID=186817 RepID=UPI00159678C4|nr:MULTISPECIES: hypothetical protein [unclassified Bacillus (in: firmicutes)]
MQRGKGYVILFSICLLISFAKLVHTEKKNQPSKVVKEFPSSNRPSELVCDSKSVGEK